MFVKIPLPHGILSKLSERWRVMEETFRKGNGWDRTGCWGTMGNPCGLLSPVSGDTTGTAGPLPSFIFSGEKGAPAVRFMSCKSEMPVCIAPLSALTFRGA